MLLPERMGCSKPPLRQEISDGRDEPSAPADDRGHDDAQSVAGDQRSYLHAVSRFSQYFGRSLDRLGLEDVRACQVHLASKGVAWGSLNQVVCALRFFYGVTLGHPTIPERIVYARARRKLPTVLSADEVVAFLESVSNLKARVALTTAYAAGLRVSEVAALKVSDIDSGRMVMRIENGKGGKERYAMLSALCWASCVAIGGDSDRPCICFPAEPRTSRLSRRFCTPPAAPRRPQRGSTSGSACMCCVTASPPTSWRAASTSASFRFCSATRIYRRRRAARASRPRSSPRSPVPWID